jgi:peptide/nickel transport system substrate-binding protein
MDSPYGAVAASLLLLVVLFGFFAVATTGPAEAQEMVVAYGNDPLSVDPRIVFTTTGESLIQHVYETLVGQDEKGNVIPKLAVSWRQVSPTILEFKLRPNVKFHNGEPFTGDSVKYTLESMVAPDTKSPKRAFLAEIEQVKIVDPLTVQLITKRPTRALLRTLTYYGAIMPAKASRELGDKMGSTAFGTGPYRVAEYVPGQRFVIEATESYWGPAPKIKKITYRIVPEDATRVAMLESAQAMMVNNLPVDMIRRIEGGADTRVDAAVTARTVYMGIKTNRGFLADPRVRQALNHAVNKQEIIETVLGGRGQVANSPIAPLVQFYDQSIPTYAYDPAKAKQLLAAAGVPAGSPLRIGIPTGRYLMDRQVGEAVAGYLKEIGFNVQVETPEWGNYYADVLKADGRFDVFMLGWGTTTLDPDFLLTPNFHSQFSKSTLYKNASVDRMLDEARQTFDDRAAGELYRRIQRTIVTDAPWIFLHYQPDLIGVNKRLQNIQRRAGNELHFFSESTLK